MLFDTKFKPKMLDKWRSAPPKAAKLQKLRQNMTPDELALTANFAWEHNWPELWLNNLTEPAAAALLADCWPAGSAADRKNLLEQAINLLKQADHQAAAKQLLLQLKDERTLNLLLPAAFSAAGKTNCFSPQLLCELLAPWREQTGRVLQAVFAELGTPGKLLALELGGLLIPANTAALLKPGLRDTAEEVRILAAKTAAVLPADTLIDFLAPALGDTAPTVRTAACETIGRCCRANGIPTLRQMLATDDAWTVKSMCSSFVSKWEQELAEQIRLDEGQLFLRDAGDDTYAKN